MSNIYTINQIRDAMLQHFDDDKDSFGDLIKKVGDMKIKIDSHDHLLKDFMECMDRIDKKLDDLKKDSEPVNQWFKNASYLKVTIIWTVGLVGSMVAIVLGVKTVFKL